MITYHRLEFQSWRPLETKTLSRTFGPPKNPWVQSEGPILDPQNMGKITPQKKGRVKWISMVYFNRQDSRLAPIQSQNRLTLRGKVSRMVGLTLGYPVRLSPPGFLGILKAYDNPHGAGPEPCKLYPFSQNHGKSW